MSDPESIFKHKACRFFIAVICLAGVPQVLLAQKQAKPVPPLYFDKGHLVYTPDSMGNRIPDFSYCGYKASQSQIPLAPAKLVVPILNGDATAAIQSAIDQVGQMQQDGNGIRGAVLLQPGIYSVKGQIVIKASGVVLRGSGSKEKGTILFGAGTTRETLVVINGNGQPVFSQKASVTDNYVPVNALSFSIDNAAAFKVGDRIQIRRPSTQEWINFIRTEHFGGGITSLGWKPGEKDIVFDRTIVSITGNKIAIDAPITTALEAKFGGASITSYSWQERIQNAGIENIQLVSAVDKSNAKDEDHRWDAISIDGAEDCWVRQVQLKNFAGSAVRLLENSRRVTVEDCISLEPISEIGGQRRYTFFTSGQQNLFQRCYAEHGYHDFATGFCAAGPNAFVQCESIMPFQFSGAIDSWASGILFDLVNVDGNALRFGNRGQDGNGAGWAAANSVFWNCTAARIDCYQPPGAQNWAFGSWSQFAGDGYWNESNNSIQPRSLYYAQLQERLGHSTDNQAQIMPMSTDASSSPSVEVAQQLTKEAILPRPLMINWIQSAATRTRLSTSIQGVAVAKMPAIAKPMMMAPNTATKISQGVLVHNGQLLTGKRINVQWWSGGVHGKDVQQAKPHLTRYVPGRFGQGLTDIVTEVAAEMKSTNTVAIEHNYGLWYDRRRDDHERIRRMDGEVWPPFYELPFARSGRETAWDGLSKYDLTKYNQFYWNRLKQFADLADQQGLVLVHQNYFQHNIIEAGAHYADFPWRTANNINNTGFVEPVNYAGDKRIFYAEQFYDIGNPVRRELHKKYIRQCLNNFKDNSGVIQLIGEEYTGPVHFVKFWLDVIRDWKKETGRHPLIGLSVTKDVQDSILALPAYASLIDIIDIRYWHYQADGSLYAPAGGQNLAPRQHARLLKPKKTSFEQVYRAVLEYKTRFPEKAVIYSGDNYPEFGMAVLMAGGSLPVLPSNIDPTTVNKSIGMKPMKSNTPNEYLLGNGKETLVFDLNTGRLFTR